MIPGHGRVARGHVVSTAMRSSRRSGFTLVELMVAVLILAVGLLAMASTAAVIIRQVGDAGRMSVGASVAQSRIEKLYAGDCKTAQTGSATTRKVSESWTVTPGTRSAAIVVTVTYVTSKGSRTQSYNNIVVCT